MRKGERTRDTELDENEDDLRQIRTREGGDTYKYKLQRSRSFARPRLYQSSENELQPCRG